MKLYTILLRAAFVALAIADNNPCSTSAKLPCTCPEGTSYLESGTYIIAGVPSAPVREIAFDFFNSTWQKRPIVSTQGSATTVGSTRTVRVSSNVGTYDIKQKLTFYGLAPDGAFKFLYEQVGEVMYKNGQGKFAGWWEHFQGENAFEYETPMRWSLYACQTGKPIDFASYATARFNELVANIAKTGQAKGKTLGPLSHQSY